MHFIGYPRNIHLADNVACTIHKQKYLFFTWDVVAFLANITRYGKKKE